MNAEVQNQYELCDLTFDYQHGTQIRTYIIDVDDVLRCGENNNPTIPRTVQSLLNRVCHYQQGKIIMVSWKSCQWSNEDGTIEELEEMIKHHGINCEISISLSNKETPKGTG